MTPPLPPQKRPLERLVARAVMAAGLVVIAGWWTKQGWLVRPRPGLAPTQFNTALGLFFGAAALLAASKGRGRAAAVAALVPLAVGGATLAEHGLGVDLGIDHLFAEPFLLLHESPGRLSQVTALCLMATALSQLLYPGRPAGWRAGLAASLSAVAGATSGFVFVGHLISTEVARGWGQQTGMALFTAPLMLALAAGQMAHMLRDVEAPRRVPGWLPGAFGAGMLALSAMFCGVLDAQEMAQQNRSLDEFASSAGALIAAQFKDQYLSLLRMARRLEHPPVLPAQWSEDARNHLEGSPGMVSLQRWDEEGRVQLSWPASAAEGQVNEPWRETLRGMTEGRAAVSRVIEVSRVPGFLIATPISAEHGEGGQLVAELRADEFLRGPLSLASLKGHHVSIRDGMQTLCEIEGDGAPSPGGGREVTLDVGRTWVLRVTPTPRSARGLRTRTPQIALGFGVFFAALFAAIAWLIVRIDEQAARLKEAEGGLIEGRRAALELARMKSEFLASMSHEIRTPLNAVIGMAELLTESGLTAPQRELAETIGHAGDALMAVIGEILDFSKLEAGKLEPEQKDYEPRKVASTALELVGGAAKTKGIEVSLEVDPGVPAYLLGDAARLRQVLLNFLSNAIKFTEAGKITLSVRHEAGAPGRVYYRVQDTGRGIDPATQTRIFQPFVQGDASTSRRHGGTGLGLVISRRLIELMGGEVGFESEVGRGSAFWFRVPAIAPARLSPAPAAPEARAPRVDGEPLRGVRVLLVDDNAVNQRVASLQLRKLGCVFDVAPGGVEAVEAAAARPYDVILMDCQMPDVDGFEATRRIRSSGRPEEKAKIIAMTANATEEDRRRCLDSGMDDFIGKPIELARLAATIERNLPPRPAA